jgi:hypothetical protein
MFSLACPTPPSLSRLVRFPILCLTLAVAAAAFAAVAGATRTGSPGTLTVTNTNDNGAGSLRRAIADATQGDTIDFALPSGSVITLTSGELVIDKSLIISGPGSYALAVSGGRTSRVLRVDAGATVRVAGLTLRDGSVSVALCPTGDCRGGGVLNSGDLTLANCVVSNNNVAANTVGSLPAAGSAFGGGVENLGRLTMNDCVVTRNGVGGGSGVISDFPVNGFGGGIDNAGELTLTRSVVSDNTASGSPTLSSSDGFGGGVNNRAGGMLNATDSAVSFNTALGGTTSRGTPGSAFGGGLRNEGAATLVNCKVFNNTARSRAGLNSAGGGGTARGGGVENSGALTLTNCRVEANVVRSSDFSGGRADGGGINSTAGTFTLSDSTVRNNLAAAGGFSLSSGNSARGGGVRSVGPLTVSNSTISGNGARGGTGPASGGSAEGGGLSCDGALEMANSTVSGNDATGGSVVSSGGSAGQAAGGGIKGGAATLVNCTVTLNSALSGTGDKRRGSGGGLSVSSSATLLNTVVAGNTAVGDFFAPVTPDVANSFVSKGRNFVGTNAGTEASLPAGSPNANGDFVGSAALQLDAQLGVLENNGGRTPTHRPRPGSPIIDAGNGLSLLPPYSLGTDQRGRPRLVGAAVDIGAVETAPPSVTFQLDAFTILAVESVGRLVVTVSRAAEVSTGAASVSYSAANGTASSRSDYAAAEGTLHFDAGERQKSFDLFITDDALSEGDETILLRLGDPDTGALLDGRSEASVIIKDDDQPPPSANPVDDARFFVRQHYVDFLGREPDAAGLDFWAGQIESCGANDGCREVRRVHVSAAFFLSIEFQETGGFAVRVRRAAFGQQSAVVGSRVTFDEFRRDARRVGEDVVVGVGNWEGRLRQNKLDYLLGVVGGADFAARFPETLTAAEYVRALFLTAGVSPTEAQRQAALAAFGAGGSEGRAVALGSVADSDSVRAAELTAAFALAEYFGYLKRNPTDAPDMNDIGYSFWLDKLDSFGGDFIRAEMVKAFITSAEYRRRFGAQ